MPAASEPTIYVEAPDRSGCRSPHMHSCRLDRPRIWRRVFRGDGDAPSRPSIVPVPARLSSRLLGQPLVEHQAREADVPADSPAGQQARPHSLIDPARLDVQIPRDLLRTKKPILLQSRRRLLFCRRSLHTPIQTPSAADRTADLPAPDALCGGVLPGWHDPPISEPQARDGGVKHLTPDNPAGAPARCV